MLLAFGYWNFLSESILNFNYWLLLIKGTVYSSNWNNVYYRELAEDGYSGVEVRTTPGKTEIIIMATRTQNVLGEKGKRIRELTAVVQKRFNFPEGSVELYAEKVATRGLCAIAQVLWRILLFLSCIGEL